MFFVKGNVASWRVLLYLTIGVNAPVFCETKIRWNLAGSTLFIIGCRDVYSLSRRIFIIWIAE
jgi:hypothetical protein